MVLEKGIPFKFTLHPSIFEDKSSLSIPLSITANVIDKELQHRLDIHVPSGPNLAGIEITHLEFIFDDSEKVSLRKANKSFCNDNGVMGYIFMQLLDSKDRPSGQPFAIASCDSATGKGIHSSVKLPLQADQHVRFYLVQRKISSNNKIQTDIRIEGIRFTGTVQLLSGGVRVGSTKTKKQIENFIQTDFKFKVDSREKVSTSSKRPRESPQYTCETKEDSTKTRFRVEEKSKGYVSGNTEEEPPYLVYAFVPGGDDES